MHNEQGSGVPASGTSKGQGPDISDLIGKPFVYGGRGPFEYDCYGLAIEIYRRMGITLLDIGSSPSTSWIHSHILEAKPLFVELKNPEPFCLVTISPRPPFTCHIGVVLENTNQFIHIRAKSCVVIERLDSLLWKNKITGYYKPRA